MPFYEEKLRMKYPFARQNEWAIGFSIETGYHLRWNREDPAPDLDALDAEIPDLEIIKRYKLDEITLARSSTLEALTVTWDGDQWDADEETSNRIANALSMIREAEAQGIPAPGEIAWRTADNQTRVLTLPQLTAMGAAVFLAQQQVWATNAVLKDAVMACTSQEEVEAIDWP